MIRTTHTACCNLSDNVTPAVVSLLIYGVQPQLLGYSAAPSSVWIAKLQPFLGLDFVLDLSILFSLRRVAEPLQDGRTRIGPN